ncbi:MAG TPA: LuxR C-terminal-related transcriptional regulator [Streptosporangiaceae bacterium]|nr:LuxR C-terminal-related transcriptional regulator [Streptosporangiaceae bacterium]
MDHRADRSRPSNLPAELTSFVGRRRELREVKHLLTTTRVLTLTGSGGAGKTRLALRAATEMARGFADGAWLVLLASIQDPLLVPQAVFGALGLQDRSASVSLSTLAEYLAGKRLLLVLDNCEHLLDGCATLVSTLVTSCPELRVLATSRQALDVAGEVRMDVPPMSLPEADDGTSLDQVLSCDAVELLSERASAVVPGFAVNAGNAAAVLSLCRRLDGIPLALELAAVRLGSLSLDQLNGGLADELSVLGSGRRGAEPRQRTLEAAIGWSYGLLGEQERLLWARLSVFAGGFEADAAIALCADARLPEDQIAGLLGALVEKSILKRQLRGSSARYWLLDTIRKYGRQRLRELGEEITAQRRHLAWICALAKVAGAWDARQAEVFRQMDRDRDNLWAALEFCLRQPGEVAVAAELALDLSVYWVCHGPLSDVRRILASLTHMTPPESLPRAQLLWVTATVATTQNDYGACAALCEESLRIGRLIGNAEIVGWSLTYLAVARWFAGNAAEATRLSQEAISLARSMHLSRLELGALNLLASILLTTGELDHVLELGGAALETSKASGELWVRSMLLNVMAQASWRQGERQHAETLAREGALYSHALENWPVLTNLVETLAWMAAEQAAHERAATLLGFAQDAREAKAFVMVEPYRPQHARSVDLATEGLGQTAFDAAFQRGAAMTIDEGVAFAVEDKPPPKPTPAVKPGPRTALTRRQLDIARLVVDDLSNKEIAARLFLSERTVETHITNILNKLGLNSRMQIGRLVPELTELD